jgi:hypothetical protein
MSINLSSFAGAGAQFFDANGAPLSGGLIYTYLSGTSTPAVTYTTRSGAANNTNPIVLNAAGRTPAEIWLDGGVLYKFVLKSSTFVQIGSYDGIPSINDPTTANNLITVAGTNALTGLATPPLEGYTAGAQFSFVAQNTNSGAVTLDIDSLGVKAVTKAGATPLVAGDIVGGAMVLVEYDGTRFQLLTSSISSSLSLSGTLTVAGAVSMSSTLTVGGALSVAGVSTLSTILEGATVTAAAPASTTQFDASTQAVQFYTTNAANNWTLNVRGNVSTSLNTLMSIGQSLSVTVLATQGATPYYQTTMTIDGAAVTVKWQGGITPNAGNANSIDAYTFAIVKTADATFTVLGSQTKFA